MRQQHREAMNHRQQWGIYSQVSHAQTTKAKATEGRTGQTRRQRTGGEQTKVATGVAKARRANMGPMREGLRRLGARAETRTSDQGLRRHRTGKLTGPCGLRGKEG